MSEFKYACPVCGQHMMCDSSQSGSIMECPTCFQKIIAPQAPTTDDPKFILTGTKYSEKKIPETLANAARADRTSGEKPFPLVIAIVLVLVLAVGAGVYFFGGNIIRHWRGAGWQSQDIGNVHAKGSFSRAGGSFTVSGDGADIWGTADAFRFVFQPLDGDGALTARVQQMKNTDAWAKAGVMFRESLEANSKFVAVAVTPGSGVAAQQRERTAAPAAEVMQVPNLAAPYWVRLVRQADTFTAWSSADGTNWTRLGATKIPMTGPIYAGLAVCSHKDGTLCPAQFDSVTLQTEREAVRTAANPPVPKLVAPAASDANWTLSPGTNPIPDTTAAGRIHGQDFIVGHASFQNGLLTLRTAARGPVEFGALIHFGGAQPESLSGQTINVMPDAEVAARVQLRWKNEAGEVEKMDFTNGYAMRLEFKPLANNRLPGKIYLTTPDAEKSYILGSFNADARKPKPKTPK